MKRFPVLFLTGILIFLSSSASFASGTKPVIITGRVLNMDPDNRTLIFQKSHPVSLVEQKFIDLDEQGNFRIEFPAYIPGEISMHYNEGFMMLVHPGDSLHVEFDGAAESGDMYASVRFTGDAAESNRQVVAFQSAWYSNPLVDNWDKKQQIWKTYDLTMYELYLDTLKQKLQGFFDDYCTHHPMSEESRIWAKTMTESEYFNQIASYPWSHHDARDAQPVDISIYTKYFERLNDMLPLDENKLICTSVIYRLANIYHIDYVSNKVFHAYYAEQLNSLSGDSARARHVRLMNDSARIDGTIRQVHDPLMRQLVLSEHFRNYLQNNDVESFEKYRPFAEKYIQADFLMEPLIEAYYRVKEQVDCPTCMSDSIYSKLKGTAVAPIFDSLLSANRGSIIYLDVWSVYCGPCRSEMYENKVLNREMSEKGVVFAYLCIDSDAKTWKACKDTLTEGGWHFLLNRNQGNALKNAFEIAGVPFHILIDKSGVIRKLGIFVKPQDAAMALQ